MDLINRLYKRTAIILIPISILSALFFAYTMPLGILLGGLLGVLNLKGLAWGVEGLLQSYKAQAKLLILSMLRFAFLAIAVGVFAVFKLVNLIGVMIGFTVVFTLLLIEGARVSKDRAEDSSM